MRELIGYCGLDCEKCGEKTAKLWAELNNAPILPGHINCEGSV